MTQGTVAVSDRTDSTMSRGDRVDPKVTVGETAPAAATGDRRTAPSVAIGDRSPDL